MSSPVVCSPCFRRSDSPLPITFRKFVPGQIPYKKKRPHFWGHSFKEAMWRECQGRRCKVPLLSERFNGSCREHWKKALVAAASLLRGHNALAEPKVSTAAGAWRRAANGHILLRLAGFLL